MINSYPFLNTTEVSSIALYNLIDLLCAFRELPTDTKFALGIVTGNNKKYVHKIKGENEEFLDNIKEKFYGEKRSGDVQQNYA